MCSHYLRTQLSILSQLQPIPDRPASRAGQPCHWRSPRGEEPGQPVQPVKPHHTWYLHTTTVPVRARVRDTTAPRGSFQLEPTRCQLVESGTLRTYEPVLCLVLLGWHNVGFDHCDQFIDVTFGVGDDHIINERGHITVLV